MKTAGQRVDSAIEASLIGMGRFLKGAAVVGHRVLTLRPARVEADLRSYLAMTALSHEAALVEAEEKEEVLAPFWSDGGPTEWLGPDELWVPPGGNPGGTLVYGVSDEDCRAQHPLYRQIQDEVASAPGSLSGSERRPGVAESPRSPATPGQPQIVGEWQFTAAEQELLDLKPGDRLGMAIVGQPVDVPPVSPAGTGAQAGTGGSPNIHSEQLVADVLFDHNYFRPSKEFNTGAQCLCGEQLKNLQGWRRHVAPYIVQALSE